MAAYILGIDQSTQGTKAILFDEKGALIARSDLAHRQIINGRGWVEHDLEEIYHNTLQAISNVVEKAGIDRGDIKGLGISNQRETTCAFLKNGEPLGHAIVWQCARAEELCHTLREQNPAGAAMVKEKTGIPLSPFFPAAKMAWILENVSKARCLAESGDLLFGTIDTYLVYRLTRGQVFATDMTNASRTQLFDIHSLSFDPALCDFFHVPMQCLPKVLPCDGDFGMTDLGGFLPGKIPIRGVLGDSHAALFGQGCLSRGQVKATYGTGSSVMMNTGETPVISQSGSVTSIAYAMEGQVNYCLEGNINYTGAVITWLKDDLKLIQSAGETGDLAMHADPSDVTYLVPAFTGLGAPYWEPNARGILTGITRTTGKNEVVRAALDSIAYQITDVLSAMKQDAGMPIRELHVDGGPTKNAYLMQFQSDIAGIPVLVPPHEELSCMGAAYCAGLSLKLYDRDSLFAGTENTTYQPKMRPEQVESKRQGWKRALRQVLR